MEISISATPRLRWVSQIGVADKEIVKITWLSLRRYQSGDFFFFRYLDPINMLVRLQLWPGFFLCRKLTQGQLGGKIMMRFDIFRSLGNKLNGFLLIGKVQKLDIRTFENFKDSNESVTMQSFSIVTNSVFLVQVFFMFSISHSCLFSFGIFYSFLAFTHPYFYSFVLLTFVTCHRERDLRF